MERWPVFTLKLFVDQKTCHQRFLSWCAGARFQFAAPRNFISAPKNYLPAHQEIGVRTKDLKVLFLPRTKSAPTFFWIPHLVCVINYIWRRQSLIWYFCLKTYVSIFIGASKGRKNQHVRAWNEKLNGQVSIIQNGKAQTQKLKSCTPQPWI